MPLTKDQKTKTISDYRVHKKDTGSAEVQVALLTERINRLAKHFEAKKKDHHSRHGLIRMVNLRKRLLTYLQKTKPAKYKEMISRLELRK